MLWKYQQNIFKNWFIKLKSFEVFERVCKVWAIGNIIRKINGPQDDDGSELAQEISSFKFRTFIINLARQQQRSSNNKRLERKSVHNVVDDVADNNVEPGYIQQQCVFRLLVMVSNNINILFPSFCYSALHSTLPPSSCVQLHIGLS